MQLARQQPLSTLSEKKERGREAEVTHRAAYAPVDGTVNMVMLVRVASRCLTNSHKSIFRISWQGRWSPLLLLLTASADSSTTYSESMCRQHME